MVKLVFALLAVGLTLAHGTPASSPLFDTLAKDGRANILVTLTQDTTSHVLNKISRNGIDYATRGAKINSMMEQLKSESARAQAGILSFLKREQRLKTQAVAPFTVKSFWIDNKIIVRGASLRLVHKLLSRPDVLAVELEKSYPAPQVQVVEQSGTPRRDEQPNIQLIRAPPVWAYGQRGENAVVANIDTGVRASHEALKDNFRSENGWFDPAKGTSEPSDENGHGTHTMGIIVGKKGIGVAPGAQFIACKGCGLAACTTSDLLACGQWVLCPTNAAGQNANCTLAPQVVSNSWGAGQGDTWFDGTLKAWREAGIVPVFASGGSGPSCGSVASPADSKLAFAVGSAAEDGTTATGGQGPTTDGRIKPDVAAPGSNIKSAFSTADDAYAVISGTSMSAPHAAGVAALLASENPKLTVAEIQALVESGAVPVGASGQTCGGIPDDQYPNNKVGHGRIDALNSIAATRRF